MIHSKGSYLQRDAVHAKNVSHRNELRELISLFAEDNKRDRKTSSFLTWHWQRFVNQ
jgi:hypothetical protein